MDIWTLYNVVGYSRTEKVERIVENIMALDRVKICYQKALVIIVDNLKSFIEHD